MKIKSTFLIVLLSILSLFAGSNSETENYKRRQRRNANRRREIDLMLMPELGYSTLSGVGGQLRFSIIRETSSSYTKRGVMLLLAGGRNSNSAGIGLISVASSGIMPAFASLDLTCIRTHHAPEYMKKYDYEPEHFGIGLNCDIGVMLGALKVGVAYFPEMERPVHLNLGFYGWFPIGGM